MKSYFCALSVIFGSTLTAGSITSGSQLNHREQVNVYSYDVQTAFDLIGGELVIGRCVLNTEMEEVVKFGKRLKSILQYNDAEPTPKVWSLDFSNHEHSRSQIRTDYKYLGFGEAKRVVLERVDISKVPATKYRITIGIGNGVPVTIKLEEIFGWSWSTPRVTDCNTDE